MKKKLRNKLTLKKETLSSLSKREMNVLRGGETWTCFGSAGCTTDPCPPTYATVCGCQ